MSKKKVHTIHWESNGYLFALRYYCLLCKSGGLSEKETSLSVRKIVEHLMAMTCGVSKTLPELVRIYHHGRIPPEFIVKIEHGKPRSYTAEEHMLHQLYSGGKTCLLEIKDYPNQNLVRSVIDFYNANKTDHPELPIPVKQVFVKHTPIKPIKNGKSNRQVRVTMFEGDVDAVKELMSHQPR